MTNDAKVLAARIDPEQPDFLITAILRGQRGGYTGRDARLRGWSYYAGMREGSIPSHLDNVSKFLSATTELEKAIREDYA